MPTSLPHEMTIAWKVTRLTISAKGLETPQCQDCGVDLSIHQPDENRPQHLLGTCDGCGMWFLIEIGNDEAFLCDLPNVALIREAVTLGKAKARSERATKGKTAARRGHDSGNPRA